MYQDVQVHGVYTVYMMVMLLLCYAAIIDIQFNIIISDNDDDDVYRQ